MPSLKYEPANTNVTMDKIKYVNDWLSELQAAVDYNSDRVGLLVESRLNPVLSNSTPEDKVGIAVEPNCDLSKIIQKILLVSQHTSHLLDDIINRLML
jgi:hypothetical protein